MKLNIGKRILLLLHWLCSLMICVAFVLCLVVPGLQANLVSRTEGALGVVGARIAGGVLLALYLALSLATLLTLLRRKRRVEKGFVTIGPENHGQVRLAVSAVEQMVRQSVRNIDGITDMKVNIEGLDDAIAIYVTATIASGAHVPTITANMQRAITQFVEVSCGVAVQSVAITINAVSGKGDAPRRRLLGFGRPQSEAPAAEPGPVETGFAESAPVTDIPVSEPAEDSEQSPSMTSKDTAGEQASGFDPDKPYESEFAKDFAAMKAREEAGESEEPETVSAED